MGMIDRFNEQYFFLSNFFAVAHGIMLDGERYNTVEAAYQAAKTLDLGWRAKIRMLYHPRDAKRMGKRVPMREDWEQVKLQIMEDLLRQKFTDSWLREHLIETHPQELIEGNTWGDKFWGAVWEYVYLPESTREYGRWVGENHLGKLLMKIRKEALSA